MKQNRRIRRWLAPLAVGLFVGMASPAMAQTQGPVPPPAAAPSAAPSAATPDISSAPATPFETPTAAPGPSAPVISFNLPHDLSPWGMFMAADIVVKAVMIGLAFASVLSWTIWFAKAIELMIARRSLARAVVALAKARTWRDAEALKGRGGSAATLIAAADTELQLSAQAMSPRPMTPDGVKERMVSRLDRAEAAISRAMVRGTGILATIGATAPFVGLFGTVWGIMNSFIGISKAHTTNLAVVAPGIAEALLATALGLVAAIPAVVMYNFFSRWIAGFKAQNGDASAEILRIVSRDFDSGAFQAHPAERRRDIAAAE
jgi:biopolymer transport protein ExbB